jgi:hypothetical protein
VRKTWKPEPIVKRGTAWMQLLKEMETKFRSKGDSVSVSLVQKAIKRGPQKNEHDVRRDPKEKKKVPEQDSSNVQETESTKQKDVKPSPQRSRSGQNDSKKRDRSSSPPAVLYKDDPPPIVARQLISDIPVKDIGGGVIITSAMGDNSPPDMDEEDNDDDDDDDDDDEEEEEESLSSTQKAYRENIRKRIHPIIRTMRFMPDLMYTQKKQIGVSNVLKPITSIAESSKDHDENNPVWKFVPFETSWIRFEKDPEYEKINLRLEMDYYDVAFSPSLIKMMGFQDYHERFSLERMRKRMTLRNALLGKEFSFRMSQVRTLKEAIAVAKISFYTWSAVRRHELYEKHAMDVDKFYNRMGKLSRQKGYATMREMMKAEFVSEDEYAQLASSVFQSETFTFMDYAVYVVMNESPIATTIFGSRYTSLTPSDLAFVYTNIIVPEVVDDKRVRLLEIMPIRSVADGQVNLLEFSNTHYKTIDVDTISDIKILILTAYGTPVPFRYGPATVQLHFRRQR